MNFCPPAKARHDKQYLAKRSGWIAAACLMLLVTTPARAENIACHVTYGGLTQIIEAAPMTEPYQAASTAIGSFFQFRIVFRRTPADLAGIKIYTYSTSDSGPALIHQGSYAYPLRNAAQEGFTGRQIVYEPLRDGELQYWCELKTTQ